MHTMAYTLSNLKALSIWFFSPSFYILIKTDYNLGVGTADESTVQIFFGDEMVIFFFAIRRQCSTSLFIEQKYFFFSTGLAPS